MRTDHEPARTHPSPCPLPATRGEGGRRPGEGTLALPTKAGGSGLALRAVGLAYVDPFVRRRVEIRAPIEEFVREYGFDIPRL